MRRHSMGQDNSSNPVYSQTSSFHHTCLVSRDTWLSCCVNCVNCGLQALQAQSYCDPCWLCCCISDYQETHAASPPLIDPHVISGDCHETELYVALAMGPSVQHDCITITDVTRVPMGITCRHCNSARFSHHTYLEVEGYSLGCTAAWVLFLQSIVELCQLLPLSLCQGPICIWLQPHGGLQSLMIFVVVRRELQYVPAVQSTQAVVQVWPFM